MTKTRIGNKRFYPNEDRIVLESESEGSQKSLLRVSNKQSSLALSNEKNEHKKHDRTRSISSFISRSFASRSNTDFAPLSLSVAAPMCTLAYNARDLRKRGAQTKQRANSSLARIRRIRITNLFSQSKLAIHNQAAAAMLAFLLYIYLRTANN
jgi:hypothetical protein